MSIKVLHQIPKGIRLNYTSIFAVCFCSTIITGGIKLNKKKLYHASVSQTVGLTKIWLPEFPEFNDTRTLVTTNNGDILSYGGGSQLCLVLKNGTWVEHSTMNIYRLGAIGITMMKVFTCLEESCLQIQVNFFPTMPQFGRKDRTFHILIAV